MTKVKFNAERIFNSDTIYPDDFIELVNKYKDQVIEADEYPFGGYDVELDGSTYALYEEDLIVVK